MGVAAYLEEDKEDSEWHAAKFDQLCHITGVHCPSLNISDVAVLTSLQAQITNSTTLYTSSRFQLLKNVSGAYLESLEALLKSSQDTIFDSR